MRVTDVTKVQCHREGEDDSGDSPAVVYSAVSPEGNKLSPESGQASGVRSQFIRIQSKGTNSQLQDKQVPGVNHK